MSFLTEFLVAAVRPSGPALIGAIGVATLCAATATRVLTPERLATLPPTTFVQDENDRHALITAQALATGHGPYQRDAVAVLGASTTLHAVAGEEALTQALGERIGRPVPAYLLCASGIRGPELHALATALNGKVGGVIVLNVSVGVLCISGQRYAELLEHPRLALDFPELPGARPPAGPAAPEHTGVFFLDHLSWFERRLPTAALRGFRPLEGMVEHPREFDPDDPEQLAERQIVIDYQLAERTAALSDLYRRFTTAELWLRGLAEIIRRERERSDATIVLLESTRSRIFRETVDPELIAAYDTAIRKLARGMGVHYWNLDADAGLRDEEFADLTHVGLPEARERYTRVLVERLAPLLVERDH